MLNNPGIIPIDYAIVKHIADSAEEFISRTREITWRKDGFVFCRGDLTLHGKSKRKDNIGRISVVCIAKDNPNKLNFGRMFWCGAEASNFGQVRFLTLFINPLAPLSEMPRHRQYLEQTIAHELTHIRDRGMQDNTLAYSKNKDRLTSTNAETRLIGYRKYLNFPVEIRAKMQELVYSLRNQKYIEFEEWLKHESIVDKQFWSNVTPKNRRKIILALYPEYVKYVGAVKPVLKSVISKYIRSITCEASRGY